MICEGAEEYYRNNEHIHWLGLLYYKHLIFLVWTTDRNIVRLFLSGVLNSLLGIASWTSYRLYCVHVICFPTNNVIVVAAWIFCLKVWHVTQSKKVFPQREEVLEMILVSTSLSLLDNTKSHLVYIYVLYVQQTVFSLLIIDYQCSMSQRWLFVLGIYRWRKIALWQREVVPLVCFVCLELPVCNELSWRGVVLEILVSSHHLSSLDNTGELSVAYVQELDPRYIQ